MPAHLALHDGLGHARAGIARCVLVEVSCGIATAAACPHATGQELAFLATEAQSIFQSGGAGAPAHLALFEGYRRAHAADAGCLFVAVSVKTATDAWPAPPPALAPRKAARPRPLTPGAFFCRNRPYHPIGYFFGQGVGATFGFPDPGGLPGLFPVPAPAAWDDLFATTW